jgi:hypothetical protein
MIVDRRTGIDGELQPRAKKRSKTERPPPSKGRETAMLFIKSGDVWRAATGEQTPHHVCSGSEKLAIAYDCGSGAALHVGSERAVRIWTHDYHIRAEGYYARTMAAHDAKGAQFAQDMMQNLVVAVMAIKPRSIELINLCLGDPKAVLRLIEAGRLPGRPVASDLVAA